MDIIKIVKSNLDKEYSKFNLLYQVCIYLLNKCKYLLNSWIICYLKFIYDKSKDIEIKGKCVLINSPWGSGKTYRFKHNIQPIFESKGYRCVYISLFGINTVDELKTKLINNCLDYKYKLFLSFFIPIFISLIFRTYGFDLAIALNDKIIIKYFSPFYILLFGGILWLIFKFMKLNFIKTVLYGLSNKFLGTGIPMNKSEIGYLFNPYCDVFVFDDLERISDDCKIREIIGFIADLKYIYGFNILIIGDENRINKDKHLNEYNLYKEKLIDYEEKDIVITEGIFKRIVEEIKNKKVKQFVKYLKFHIKLENNNYQKIPTTKNLRLILRCIDDIKRLFNNKSINNENLYWISDNFECGIDNILNTDDKQIFVLDNDIKQIIDLTIERYIYGSMTNEELEKEQTISQYRIIDVKSDKLKDLNDINNKEFIENDIYKNKLQILILYCEKGYLDNEISEELFHKIKENLIKCSKKICNLDNIRDYIQSFANLCVVAIKDINEYQQHFIDLAQNILERYYDNFYSLSDLFNWDLSSFFYNQEIRNLINNKVKEYRKNNAFSFFKKELKDLDNNFVNKMNFENNIRSLLNTFFSSYIELIQNNPKILLDIYNDLESYNHPDIIKHELLYGLKTYWKTIWYGDNVMEVLPENALNDLNISKKEKIDGFIEQLSKYYSTPRQKLQFNSFKDNNL